MSWNVTQCNKEQADTIVRKYVDVPLFVLTEFSVSDGEAYATGWSPFMGPSQSLSIWYRISASRNAVYPIRVELQKHDVSVRYDFNGCDKITRMMNERYQKWLKGSEI